jgi:xylulokinase
MTPYWDPQARGAIVGFTSAHTRPDMYRALLEGVALEQALVTAMIEERAAVAVREFIAIGGGAASDLWLKIVADTSGKVVRRSQTVEASSLGAAVCAAVGAKLYSSMSQAAEAMSGAICWETAPDPSNMAIYRELMEIYRELYPRLRDSFRRLGRFA